MIRADAFVIDLPVLVKAVPGKGDGRQMIEVQASAEVVDSEGDLIMQSALLDGAPDFLKSGHIDIDHLSEVGARFGLTNLDEWIVGKPTEVRDIGKGCTSVLCEMNQSRKAGQVWETLNRTPPVEWRSSIYGFPTGAGDSFVDVTKGVAKGDNPLGAKRFIVKSMDWKSLALTQRPICDAITGSARIVMAKAMLGDIAKSGIRDIDGTLIKAPTSWQYPDGLPLEMIYPPRSVAEIEGQYLTHIQQGRCAYAGGGNGRSVFAFRNHFIACCGMPYDDADIFAYALARKLKSH